MRRFDEQVVLITGAASGIGRASAMAFAAEGAHVALADIDSARLAEAAADLRDARVMSVSGDLSEEPTARQAVEKTVHEFGRLDVLCNSAGMDFAAGMEATAGEDWDRVTAVNERTTFLLCKYAIPFMLARGGGAIINIASGAALHPVPGRPAYTASKGAIVALTRSLALDFAPHIRVNCVCPGAVDTPMLQTLLDRAPDPAAARAALIARYPLARLAEASDIAHAVLFLASREASFITGATLAVDGGRTMH